MLETPKAESSAHLRHEFRTPVNHIMGYSDLLIDEAEDRRLRPFVPAFRQIREGGQKVLDSIERAFDEQSESAVEWQSEVFRNELQELGGQMSGTLASLRHELDQSHNETLADLAAISGAIRRLGDLTGKPTVAAEPNRAVLNAHSQGRLPAPATRGGTILIADDDHTNRDLLRRRLECEGHVVVEARNGAEVFEKLRERACDLVLLDILMPVMDGFQTLARIKQDSTMREVPVIMISALDELQSVVRCIEMGAVDYLPKPFNRVLLRARISASLERKRLVDRERRKTEELERTLSLLEQAQDQLQMQASRDALTGLANRRTVEMQLDARVKRGEPFTAIYIDLNGFKKINDSYGHSAGDDLLRQVGSRLRSAFRPGDTIGRWGGDEFVAFVDADQSEAQKQMTRVRESLAEHFLIEGGQRRVAIGAAVGAATWKPNDTASELLHRADFAMYEEKLRSAG